MLIDILLVLAGATAGTFGVRKFWPRIEKVTLHYEECDGAKEVLPMGQRRFRVIFATDSGSSARQLYEKVTPHEDALVRFFDNDRCRGTKVSVEMPND